MIYPIPIKKLYFLINIIYLCSTLHCSQEAYYSKSTKKHFKHKKKPIAIPERLKTTEERLASLPNHCKKAQRGIYRQFANEIIKI